MPGVPLAAAALRPILVENEGFFLLWAVVIRARQVVNVLDLRVDGDSLHRVLLLVVSVQFALLLQKVWQASRRGKLQLFLTLDFVLQ